MSIGEIVAVDLPTIIILIVLWILNYFKVDKLEKTMNEIRSRVGPPR